MNFKIIKLYFSKNKTLMKIRIKGTEKIFNNRKEIKDAIGQFKYNQLLKDRGLEYLDENGEVVVNVPIKPIYNKQTNKRVVKVYSSTEDLIF